MKINPNNFRKMSYFYRNNTRNWGFVKKKRVLIEYILTHKEMLMNDLCQSTLQSSFRNGVRRMTQPIRCCIVSQLSSLNQTHHLSRESESQHHKTQITTELQLQQQLIVSKQPISATLVGSVHTWEYKRVYNYSCHTRKE